MNDPSLVIDCRRGTYGTYLSTITWQNSYSFIVSPALTYPAGHYTLTVRIHVTYSPCVTSSDEHYYYYNIEVKSLNSPPYYLSSVTTSY